MLFLSNIFCQPSTIVGPNGLVLFSFVQGASVTRVLIKNSNLMKLSLLFKAFYGLFVLRISYLFVHSALVMSNG